MRMQHRTRFVFHSICMLNSEACNFPYQWHCNGSPTSPQVSPTANAKMYKTFKKQMRELLVKVKGHGTPAPDDMTLGALLVKIRNPKTGALFACMTSANSSACEQGGGCLMQQASGAGPMLCMQKSEGFDGDLACMPAVCRAMCLLRKEQHKRFCSHALPDHASAHANLALVLCSIAGVLPDQASR